VQASEGSFTEGSPRCVTVQSTLFLVDLAGSERVGETGAVGEAAKEGASINNRCVRACVGEPACGQAWAWYACVLHLW